MVSRLGGMAAGGAEVATIFIGGSRHLLELPLAAAARLDNIIAGRHRVVVGDADGVDAAVQRYLQAVGYRAVTVFCSADRPRHLAGAWPVQQIRPPKGVRGVAGHAAKDREMADNADFGLMVWDGASPGTALNLLRLATQSKKTVLFTAPTASFRTIANLADWRALLAERSPELVASWQARATPEEWRKGAPLPGRPLEPGGEAQTSLLLPGGGGLRR